MIREIFKKEQYSPISLLEGNKYRLMWDKVDMVDNIYQEDENGERVVDEEGNFIIIGEKETDYCMCTHETVELPKGFIYIRNMIDKGKTLGYKEPNMVEWSAWINVIVTYEPNRLRYLKECLTGKITDYDKATYEVNGDNAVNDFTIGGVHLWLDKSTRVGLDLRFEAEVAAGKTETTLWHNGMNFTLQLSGDASAFALLYAIELYASACYDNTQQHFANASNLETEEAVIAYDYTVGYPDKLVF